MFFVGFWILFVFLWREAHKTQIFFVTYTFQDPPLCSSTYKPRTGSKLASFYLKSDDTRLLEVHGREHVVRVGAQVGWKALVWNRKGFSPHKCKICKTEPEFLNLKDPRHRFHKIDSLWEINYNAELILGYIASMWRNWRFQNCSSSYVVCRGRQPNWSTHFQHANNIAAVDSGGKVDSCFGTWPTRFQTWFFLNSRDRFFYPVSRPKIPAQIPNL